MPSRLQIGLPTGVTFAPLSSAASNLSFRPAVLADTDRVVALVESAYRGDSSRAGWTTEADLLDGQRTDAEEVATLIGRDGSIILLAERHGRPVGCCHLDHHDASTAYFGMFAVEPSSKGAVWAGPCWRRPAWWPPVGDAPGYG